MTIVVAAAISCPPIDMHITSSMRVQVIFDTSKQYVEGDSALSLTLFLCSRCGVGGECTCGWRKQHVILPEMERQSVLQFIASTLPRIPAQALPCYRLRVDEAGKRIATTFCVQVYKHEVQRLIVEYPYAVFKMKLSFGNLRWRIARRFSEFVELHTRLKILVEESMLPRLPPTAWLSATEPSFLFQRRLMLENYLKGMFMVGALQDSVPLLVFLGVLSTTYFDHVALRSYRSQILHLQVLEFYTRPGDLILFNGRAKVSVLQRSITRSEWDHVAIVVPPSEGEYLQLLEATGDGVTLTPLTARLLAYSAFHVRYFVLRKLRTPLLSRAVVNDLLKRFTAEVEGLCYGLSFRKILYTGQVEQRSQNSTYFCSELIAEAYKSLGIISSSSEANNFWPGSFSPGDFVDTELARHGASLSPEIIIDCKLLEVATATRD
ncbi:hypothetical protein F442_11202 [Phytophthora nicotianae P10297]|uniref:PX domain-containing protein n=1 Tax=Phytophthora nicotianae P10297 TaxID=1317064 RepID=W2Z3E5_PHYNI|nr:hypothetical protein F442_11202 [Phytophthora nicotianae P10297]